MAREGVRLVLLCEDDEHRRFAYHVFSGLGRHYRQQRALVCPSGRGSAEKWVRQRYAEEVRAHRRRASSQRGIALAVIIDADQQTVAFRHGQLSATLRESALAERAPNERIIVWVPKRHIETWVAHLLGHQVNEQDDCKPLVRGEDYRRPAAKFVRLHHNRNGRPANLLPSLDTALAETDRLQTG